MVQLKILSGKMAGTAWVARRFPVRIGRTPGADLRLEEAGVWDDHLRLEFHPAEGVVLSPQAEALAAVNGEPVREPKVLRSGDVVDIGQVKFQFWLSENSQHSQSLREWLIWIGIGAVTLGQIGLIYWLLR